jgi:Ca-activated chloride channel homolog
MIEVHIGRCITRVVWTALLLLAAPAAAQVALPTDMAIAHNVLVPQSRALAFGGAPNVRITGVDVGVVILEQAARTTIDVHLRNEAGRDQEAELLLPLPDGAAIRRFAFDGEAAEPTARLLPKAEASSTYHAIVARVRDPALLEFVGHDLVRSSVFPVPAGGTQQIRVTYDHLLARDGERVDYLLPRSESIGYDVPWTISVQVQSAHSLATLYSPSHDIETIRGASNRVSARLSDAAASEPGPFRLSYLLAGDGPTASLFAYPDATGHGGTFLLLAGLPAPGAEPDAAAQRREVTLVLDCSGSMAGDKLDQARAAALQVLEGLEDGESFNVLVYSDQVSMFGRRPVTKDADTTRRAREYLASVRSGGGTNIHEALTRALSQDTTAGALPMVLFLTDGLPTVGIVSEAAIGEQAVEANPHERRVFAFGVGYDVNAPLLDRLAAETRGTATYVQPEQDVEVAVSTVFRRLSGPVLAGTDLQLRDADGGPAIGRVLDVVPGRLPDLFEGDQLVVLGRYVGHEPLRFALGGSYRGHPRSFLFEFPLDGATTDNAFVPRLWASRRIAALSEEIRQSGAARGTVRVTELTDEIVDLSTEYGILTEYTAFLALEGTDLSDRDDVMARAAANFQDRAISTRSGIGAVNQSMNQGFQTTQSRLNVRNEFYDAQMNRVAVTDVQQVNDRAFFRRGSRWVDSRLARVEAADPATVIEFGSPEHLALVQRLAAEGRAGSVSLGGEILLQVDGEPVLIRGN